MSFTVIKLSINIKRLINAVKGRVINDTPFFYSLFVVTIQHIGQRIIFKGNLDGIFTFKPKQNQRQRGCSRVQLTQDSE